MRTLPEAAGTSLLDFLLLHCCYMMGVPNKVFSECLAKKNLHLNKQIRAIDWIITAVINMFQLAKIILTLTDALSSCQKMYPMVVEEMLLCFRKVKLLACIKQRKQPRKLLKLLELG